MPSRVIVIGGGFAGLSAAHHLRATGYEVQILEAGPTLGGRAAGGAAEDFRWDGGAHGVSARDHCLAELIESVGRSPRLLPLRPERLLQVRGGRATEIDPARTLGIASIPGVRLIDALRLRRLPRLVTKFQSLLDPEEPLRAARLDDRSVADFVRLYFGSSALDGWAAPLLEGDLLCDPAETSRLAFVLHHLSRHEAPTGTLRGGFADLANALGGPADRTSAPVRSIEASGRSLQVAAELDGTQAMLEADAVVVATPAEEVLGLADPLLSHAERQVFAQARSVPAIVLVAGLEGSFAGKASRYRFLPSEGRPVAAMSVESGEAPEAAAPEGCERAVLVARADWSAEHLAAPDDVVTKTLLGSLGRVLPGADRKLRFTRLLRYERALPSFPVGRYRQLATLARVEADHLARGRRLVFAGDYRIAPTVEGAVASGAQAARRLADALA